MVYIELVISMRKRDRQLNETQSEHNNKQSIYNTQTTMKSR